MLTEEEFARLKNIKELLDRHNEDGKHFFNDEDVVRWELNRRRLGRMCFDFIDGLRLPLPAQD